MEEWGKAVGSAATSAASAVMKRYSSTGAAMAAGGGASMPPPNDAGASPSPASDDATNAMAQAPTHSPTHPSCDVMARPGKLFFDLHVSNS